MGDPVEACELCWGGEHSCAKLVLLAIADHMNDESGWAWPSVTRQSIVPKVVGCQCDDDGFCHPAWLCRCCLAAEVEALRGQVQRVRELHRNHDDCPDGFEDCAGYGKCRKCGEAYPCQTIRALDGDG